MSLNQIEHFLILASAGSGCISISVFVSLADISIVVTISAVVLKICAIAPAIKKYKSISISQ